MEKININIWDDYCDDGYMPKGEKQETYIYVEQDDIDDDLQKRCLEIFLKYLNNLKLKGVKFWIEFEKTYCSRWEIIVENLTHEKREEILESIEEYKSGLTCDNVPLYIYSES